MKEQKITFLGGKCDFRCCSEVVMESAKLVMKG